MPTSVSPIAAARSFSPTTASQAAAPLAGGAGMAAFGPFAALLNQQAQPSPESTSAAPVVATIVAPGAIGADAALAVPTNAPLIGSPPIGPPPVDPSLALETSTTPPIDEAPDRKDDADTKLSPPDPSPAIDPTQIVQIAVPPPPPAPILPTGPLAATVANPVPNPDADSNAGAVTPMGPTGEKASEAIDADPRQQSAPSRTADQRKIASQARLSSADEEETVAVAPTEAGTRPANAVKPTASRQSDQGLATEPPPPAQASASSYAPPASASPSLPNRVDIAPVTRQSQAAAPQTSAPVKSSADPVPTVAIPSLEQSAPPVAAASPSAPSAAPMSEVRQAPASAPTPAAQVAQAFVEPVKIALTKQEHDPAAPHVTTIQITPVELGRVEVRIERLSDGPAKIQLVAERADTLSRLVQDQSQLHQALDQAGIPQHSRTLEFSLAPTPNSSFTSQYSGSTGSGDNPSGGSSQRQGGRYPEASLQFSDNTTALSAATTRTLRSGIDITA